MQHKYDFWANDILIHITPEEDAELKKQPITKIPIKYKEKIQKIFDEVGTSGIIEGVGLDAA